MQPLLVSLPDVAGGGGGGGVDGISEWLAGSVTGRGGSRPDVSSASSMAVLFGRGVL